MHHHGGVEIICFASLYALALVLEFSRLFWRGTIVRPLTLALVGIGIAVQTWFLAAWTEHTGLLPVTTLYDSLLVLSWILAVICGYLTIRYPAGPGLLFLPIILGLLIVARYLESQGASQPAELDRLMRFWGTVHGLFLILGFVAVTVGFAAGVMYLIQAHRLKAKVRPAPGLRSLPSLESLERANKSAITVAFPLLTFGLVIGLILTFAVQARQAPGLAVSWRDSKVISTAAFWLLFALLLHARYRPDQRGRKVAILTIVAFGFLIFTLVGVNLLTNTWHSAISGGAL